MKQTHETVDSNNQTTNVVFRAKLSLRLLSSVLLLGLLVASGWFARISVLLLSGSAGSSLVAGLSVLTLFAMVVALLGTCLFAGYATLFFWTYRLEFGATRVRTRGLPYPTLPRLNCAYNDVLHVRRGPVRGTVKIVCRQGRPWQAGLGLFEGKPDRVLTEIYGHVSPERIAPDLKRTLWKYTGLDRIQVVLAVLLLLSQGINLLFVFGPQQVFSRVAWQSAWDGGLFSRVQAFSLDDNGYPWLVTQTDFNAYQVRQIAPGRTQMWNLPNEAQWPLNWQPWGLLGVIHDDAGQPYLVSNESLLHWTGMTWQTIPFSAGADSLRTNSASAAVCGSQLFALASTGAEAEEVLFNLDQASNVSGTIPLPSLPLGVDGQFGNLHALPDCSMLVSIAGAEQKWLYRLQGNRWQETGWPIELPRQGVVYDFTLGPQGEVWILLRPDHNTLSANAIGRLDPATNEWTWSQITPTDDRWPNYYYMEVDAQGRAWLAGSSSRGSTEFRRYDGPLLSVFEPAWGDTAQAVVHYTKKNSGYSSLCTELRLGPDGRIWADGKWIDSTAESLPRPLPDWIAALVGIETLMAWSALTLLSLAFYFGVFLFQNRRKHI